MDDYNKMYNLLGSDYTDKFMKMKVKVILKKKVTFQKVLSTIKLYKYDEVENFEKRLAFYKMKCNIEKNKEEYRKEKLYKQHNKCISNNYISNIYYKGRFRLEVF